MVLEQDFTYYFHWGHNFYLKLCITVQKTTNFLHHIWDSCFIEDSVNVGLLGSNVTQTCEQIPFQWNILPPSLRVEGSLL